MPDGRSGSTLGVVRGRLTTEPAGGGGFGYDPYFWLPDHRLTAAELTPEEKNRCSHRGKALRVLREALLTRSGVAPSGVSP